MFRRRSRLLVLALMVLASVFNTNIAGFSPTSAQKVAAPPDLAALVFTADDLAEFGFEGYGVDSASPYDLAADAEYISDVQQLDPAEVEETFADAGHQGSYTLLYKSPADPDDPAGAPIRELQTSAYLFADADAAEAAYHLIADESQIGGADIDNAGLGIGDESEMTTLMWSADPNYGLPNNQIELEILYDRLVLEVSTYDYDPDTAGMPIFESDEMSNVEALGDLLVERAEAALEGEAPNLMPLVVRLESDLPYDAFQMYELLDGAGIRMITQPEEAFTSSVERRLDLGTRSILRTEQVLTESTAGEGEIRFYVGLLQFERRGNAGDYMDGLVDILSANERYISVEAKEVPGLGDQALAVTLEFEDDAGDATELVELFVRVGDTVAAVWIDQPGRSAAIRMPSLDTLIELGEAQIDCIDAGGCDAPVAMPDELAELIDGTGPGADDDDESSADKTDREDGLYESPNYGYSLVYDTEEWEILLEDETPNDPYDTVYLFNGTSLIGLAGDPDYEETDLASCIADYGQSLEQEDGVTDVRRVRGRGSSGSEEGREWVTFDYISVDRSGSETETTRYYECRSLGDGVSLVVMHDAATEAFDDEVDAREALLEGFEPDDGR